LIGTPNDTGPTLRGNGVRRDNSSGIPCSFILKSDNGQNRVKLFGQEFEISRPSLVVFLAGCGIFVMPFFLPHEQVPGPPHEQVPAQSDASPKPSPPNPVERCNDFTGTYGTYNPGGKASIACTDGWQTCELHDPEPTHFGAITPDPRFIHRWIVHGTIGEGLYMTDSQDCKQLTFSNHTIWQRE
jgi:hypothetical protein